MGGPQGRPARRREAHRRGRLPNPEELLHSLRPGGREARAHGGASGRRRGFALPHRRVDGGGQVGAKGPDRGLFYLGARRRRTALAGRRGFGHRAAYGDDPPPGCRWQRHPLPPAVLFAFLRGDHLPRGAGEARPTGQCAGGDPYPDALQAGGLDRLPQAHRRRYAWGGSLVPRTRVH
jgi:hypothetical protein